MISYVYMRFGMGLGVCGHAEEKTFFAFSAFVQKFEFWFSKFIFQFSHSFFLTHAKPLANPQPPHTQTHTHRSPLLIARQTAAARCVWNTAACNIWNRFEYMRDDALEALVALLRDAAHPNVCKFFE